MPPDVSILIISYNTREMTLECIRSVIRETTGHTFEIIVVDNLSADGSADAIAQEFPAIQMLRAKENLGFARANNVAAKMARGRFLLLLNPDTVVLERAIDRLLDFAEANPDAKVWGGRTVFADGSLNPTSCWGQITLRSLFFQALGLRRFFPASQIFNSESYGDWKRDTVRHVDIVTGCFLLIRRDDWNALDGFNPLFFMYGEEADLCLRARRLGARPLLCPAATIIHYGSASDTVRIDKRIAVLKARVTLIREHWSPLRNSLGLALFALMAYAHSMAYSLTARLAGRESMKQSANYYRQIWTRRKDWLTGYPAPFPKA